jgi:tetratricopeptide (TPR) repeat protein
MLGMHEMISKRLFDKKTMPLENDKSRTKSNRMLLLYTLLLISTSFSTPASADSQSDFVDHDSEGIRKLKNHDNEGALEEFNLAIQAKPEYGVGYTNRMIANYRLGNWEAVLADYESLLKTQPQLVRALVFIYDVVDCYSKQGSARFKQGDNAGAIASFDKAIYLWPYNPVYFHGRALAKQESDDTVGAEEDLNREKYLRQSAPLDEEASVSLLCRAAAENDPQHWSDSTQGQVIELYERFAANLQKAGDAHGIEKYSTGWASELILQYEQDQATAGPLPQQPFGEPLLIKAVELRDSLRKLAGKEAVDEVEQRLPRVPSPKKPKPPHDARWWMHH